MHRELEQRLKHQLQQHINQHVQTKHLPSPDTIPGLQLSPTADFGDARQQLLSFLSAFHSSPAAGPWLLGLLRLFEQQLGSEEVMVWSFEESTLCNGGDVFMHQAVALCGAIKLCRVQDRMAVGEGMDLEGGEGNLSQMHLMLQTATWTSK